MRKAAVAGAARSHSIVAGSADAPPARNTRSNSVQIVSARAVEKARRDEAKVKEAESKGRSRSSSSPSKPAWLARVVRRKGSLRGGDSGPQPRVIKGPVEDDDAGDAVPGRTRRTSVAHDALPSRQMDFHSTPGPDASLAVARTRNAGRARAQSSAPRPDVRAMEELAAQRAQAEPEEEMEPGENDLRQHTGAFNVSATSQKPPDKILKEITKVLKQCSISFKAQSKYLLVCQKKTNTFEVEICKLYDFANMHVVKTKRLSGSVWTYKGLCLEIFTQISGKL